MKIVKEAVASYGINPTNITQITNTLYKVTDMQQIYALKRCSLLSDRKQKWENAFIEANENSINEILPVYITRQGTLLGEYHGESFYMMPWIHTTKLPRKDSIKQFYTAIGNIHQKTKRSQQMKTNDMIHHFDTYKAFCVKTKNELLQAVKTFEKNRFMSPLELQICTHFPEVNHVIDKVIYRIEQFIEDQQEQSTWNYSLCHNDLKLSHTLLSPVTYIINWEHSTYDNVATDLALFFKNENRSYDVPTDLLMDNFSVYMEKNELEKNELYLLTIHLLDPSKYITIVQNYINKGTTRETMINQVKQLQMVYRQLRFGLTFSDYIEKEFETITLDDLDS